MYCETTQTVGPGWHRSYKPSHYEDMTWTPSSRHFRSPGSSPETYRRIIRDDEDFPSRNKDQSDEFFGGRRSPTFPRRVFKEVWNESSSPNSRFTERPKMFKRVFRPDRWEDDFDRDIPHLRRVEREFDRSFNDQDPARYKKLDEDFEKHFNSRKGNDFVEPEGKVHHIPIMVERRMDEMKSRFGRGEKSSPEERNEENYTEEWVGPQVNRIRKNFEQPEELVSKFGNYRDSSSRPRFFSNTASESWDPHAIHTLPTRKAHKSSQSFDDSRHPVPPKYVSRSYSETHEDSPKPQQHSTAFRSHSDGHCPKQTYVTKIQLNLPSQKEKDELGSPSDQSNSEMSGSNCEFDDSVTREKVSPADCTEDATSKLKGRNKYENPSMQQIAVVLQNVEDLVTRVDNYSGCGRDKQYRFLDEMLTRCMLRLDDVETDGREDIRYARKAAVREVQNCIDKLEAKADESERASLKASKSPLHNATDEEEKEVVNSNQAIPLPCTETLSSEAIPLGDKTDEQQHQNKAIPLGYNQDSDAVQNVDINSPNGEQTKL